MSIFDLNRATIIGNITRDPELTYTAKGTALVRFGVATNRSTKNEDGSYTNIPTYHNVVAWSKIAERIAKSVKKGSKVYIEGRIDNRSYEKDGVTKYVSEIIVENLIPFERLKGVDGQSAKEEMPPPPEEELNSSNRGSDNSSTPQEQVDPDDIPF